MYGLSGLVIAAFLYVGLVTILSENNGKQDWAQDALVVLFTATVSAVVG